MAISKTASILRSAVYTLLSVSVAVSMIYALFEFAVFLYRPPIRIKTAFRWTDVTLSLLTDQALIALFILQHVGMASETFKNALSPRLDVVRRTVYVLSTALTLQAIVRYWQGLPDVVIWYYSGCRAPFICVHIIGWIIVCVGNVFADPTELLGVKQIYCNIDADSNGYNDPLANKSFSLRRLLSNVRHPSFMGFLLVLWVVPVMSLDKLLLSSVMSAYMYLAWCPDESDYRYHASQYTKKIHEINYLK